MRLVTRSDFDGSVCTAILEELGLIDDILYVHPKDMQDGIVEITGNDITANLPYVEGVHLAFDHHVSETHRLEEMPANYICDPNAPSAARDGGAQRCVGVAGAGGESALDTDAGRGRAGRADGCHGSGDGVSQAVLQFDDANI